MADQRTVLITGAAGNIGGKLRQHLAGRCLLRLLDKDNGGDNSIVQCDLAESHLDWTDCFAGVETVFHLAADPTAQQTWPKVVAPNIDATIHVFNACVEHGVKRIVFASSNHVMGGYKNQPAPHLITTDLPPLPGTHYDVEGEARNSTAYAATKLFGERLGKALAEEHGFSFIAARLGWVRPGENRAADVPADREAWFRLMWLSNRDCCQLMERCLLANLSQPFAIVNGMSANTGMRWDLEGTRRLIGYAPIDDAIALAPLH